MYGRIPLFENFTIQVKVREEEVIWHLQQRNILKFRIVSNLFLIMFSCTFENVTTFSFDCNTGKYQDNAGHGTIPANARLTFAQNISYLFEKCGKVTLSHYLHLLLLWFIWFEIHLLDIENEPPKGLFSHKAPRKVPFLWYIFEYPLFWRRVSRIF